MKQIFDKNYASNCCFKQNTCKTIT